MLRELRSYENLGTPAYFWELLNVLKSNDLWTRQNVQAYFFNKIIDGRSIFDGCLPLLELVKVIYIEGDTEEIKVGYEYRNILHSEQLCQQKLLECFLNEFNEDLEFHKIFSNSHFDYLEQKSVVVDKNAFSLQYSNIRKLLVDFGFLVLHPNMPGKFIINSKWKKYFDINITPNVRRSLGIEELKKRIEEQELSGEEAERFVLEFERRRLNDKEGLQWVAPYDSAAGFDILSYESPDSDDYRYIEVKSYIGVDPYFFWSRNEMNVAGQYTNQYFIYLVNRDDMSNEGYVPKMISNPIQNILKNHIEWDKCVEKYFISTFVKDKNG